MAQLSDVEQTEKIHQALEEKNLLPSEYFADAGYVDSTLLVSSQEKYQFDLIGPIRPN
jgi:transposase